MAALFCSKKEFECDREDEDEGQRCVEQDGRSMISFLVEIMKMM